MNSHPLVLNDWFAIDKAAAGGDEWIMVKVPVTGSSSFGWKGYVYTWLKDTARASLADALAPRIIQTALGSGGGGAWHWVAILVMRQYVLPCLI